MSFSVINKSCHKILKNPTEKFTIRRMHRLAVLRFDIPLKSQIAHFQPITQPHPKQLNLTQQNRHTVGRVTGRRHPVCKLVLAVTKRKIRSTVIPVFNISEKIAILGCVEVS